MTRLSSQSTYMPADARPGQGFGEVMAQLCDTWKTMNKLKHTPQRNKSSKRWKERGERAEVELCGGMYSEERRKNGEEL